jgi:hypothetical protein
VRTLRVVRVVVTCENVLHFSNKSAVTCGASAVFQAYGVALCTSCYTDLARRRAVKLKALGYVTPTRPGGLLGVPNPGELPFTLQPSRARTRTLA